ncbi:MAG: hypothetical protein RLZZ185_1514, partial [Bacteroidota bacterium]
GNEVFRLVFEGREETAVRVLDCAVV